MILIAYFSASGVTKKLAINLANYLKADIFEIEPEVKYSEADLKWTNLFSRSSKEMRSKTSRPPFIKKDLNLSKYDVIYLGFPIWWYTAPRIINTFLEAYDFSNKKIILFATSGGSNFGSKTSKSIKASGPNSDVIEGVVNPKDFSWVKL